VQPRPVKDKEKSGGGRGDHAREFAPQAMGILTRQCQTKWTHLMEMRPTLTGVAQDKTTVFS